MSRRSFIAVLAVIAAVTGVALAIAAAGSDPDTTTRSGATTPGTEPQTSEPAPPTDPAEQAPPVVDVPDPERGSLRRRGPWRFARSPIVVLARPAEPDRRYAVYFRLNRRVKKRSRLIVWLNGITTHDVTGVGYDSGGPGRCYTRLFSNFPAYPRSLRRSRPGDLMTVRLTFRRPRGSLRIRVPLVLGRVGGGDAQGGDSAWTDALGCP